MIWTLAALLISAPPPPCPALAYASDAACPAEPAFRDEVNTLLGRDPFAGAACASPALVVLAHDDTHGARVTVSDGVAVRAFDGPPGTCAELVARAATAVAVLLDAPQSERTTELRARAPVPNIPTVVDAAPAPAPARGQKPRAPRLWGPVLGLAAAGSVGDGLVFGVLGYALRAHAEEGLRVDAGLLERVDVLLELGASGPQPLALPGATLTGVRGDALVAFCGATGALHACGGLRGGLLALDSAGLRNARTGVLPALDAVVRVALHRFDGPLAAWVALDGGLPIARPQVTAVSGNAVYWAAAPVSLGLSAGGGVDLAAVGPAQTP